MQLILSTMQEIVPLSKLHHRESQLQRVLRLDAYLACPKKRTVSLVTPTCSVFIPCRRDRAGRNTSRPVGNVALKAGRLINGSTVQKEMRMRRLGHAEKA